jgi:hypothetical protein
LPAFAGVAVTLASVAGWAGHELAATRQREARFSARLAALEAGASPTRTVVEREVVREVHTLEAPQDDPTDRREPTRGVDDAKEIEEEIAITYAKDFETESVDRQWARDAEPTYLAAIQRVLPSSSKVVDFECRSRFCSLEVIHDSIDASNEFLLDLYSIQRRGPLNDTSSGFRSGDPELTPDGKLLFRVFIARPGVPLALAN